MALEETYPGLEAAALEGAAAALLGSLPATHRALLGASDGLSILAGSYRLFGVANPALPDLLSWNAPETWRFAWAGRADPYLCFGASALGDPYAYRLADLGRAGEGPEPPVVELYAVTLDPISEHPSFAAFFAATFLDEPDTVHHARIRRERAKAGRFPLDRFLVYAPSPLLVGGRTDVQRLVSLPAAQAMIVYGDIATQIGDRDDLAGLRELTPYTDEAGRERIRLDWDPEAVTRPE